MPAGLAASFGPSFLHYHHNRSHSFLSIGYMEMADVLQDSYLRKHRLSDHDAFYFPNFVTVSYVAVCIEDFFEHTVTY